MCAVARGAIFLVLGLMFAVASTYNRRTELTWLRDDPAPRPRGRVLRSLWKIDQKAVPWAWGLSRAMTIGGLILAAVGAILVVHGILTELI